MLVIQFFLLLGALVVALYFFVRRADARVSALATLAFCAFILAAIYAMLRPHDVTRVAHLLDVGRGADLLLYGLVVVFVMTTTMVYFKFVDLQAEYTRLARAVALAEAHRENARLVGPDAPGRGAGD